MTERQDALDEILSIARRHHLTLEDIAAAFQMRGRDETTAQVRRSGVIARLFAYIGGIFVFAGIVTLVGMQWEYMASPARIIVTFGSGFAAFVMALAALSEERYLVAATPLFLIAAALQPTGMLVTFHEYATGGDPLHAMLTVTAAMAVQYGVTFWKTRRSTLLFVVLFFMMGLFWTAFELIDMSGEWAAVVIGASLLSVAYGIDRSPHAVITPFWYFLGSVHLFVGAFEILKNSIVEILYLGIASSMIYVSVVARSRTILVTSTIAMLCYIGYFTGEHFADVVGWPIALIIFGLIMIGSGALAFRINRKYLRSV